MVSQLVNLTARINATSAGLAQGSRRRLQTAGHSACAAVNVTGTTADYARCEVAGLFLASNGLDGELPPIVLEPSSLPFLRQLILGNNSLRGSLQANTDYSHLDVLDVSGNQLDYPPPTGLLGACLGGAVACLGYPPLSCNAFGPRFLPRTDSPNSCTECASIWNSIGVLLGIFALFCLALALYAYMIHKHDGLTTQGVSTAAIVVTHLQTVFIVSKLRLAWPQSTTVVFSFLIVNGLQLEGARPECLFQDTPDVPFFYLFSITRVSLPILLLAGCSGLRIALRSLWARRNGGKEQTIEQEKKLDKLERTETIIFQLQLTSSWRSSFELIRAINSGANDAARVLAYTGAGLAILLLLFQVRGASHFPFAPTPPTPSTPPTPPTPNTHTSSSPPPWVAHLRRRCFTRSSTPSTHGRYSRSRGSSHSPTSASSRRRPSHRRSRSARGRWHGGATCEGANLRSPPGASRPAERV